MYIEINIYFPLLIMVFQHCITLFAEILAHQFIGRIVEAIGPLELGECHHNLPKKKY